MQNLSHRNKFNPILPDERRTVFAAGTMFFLLLCSYYVLRPVRDEMAVQMGTESLKWLFSATFAGMLLLMPLFGWLVSRFRRALLVPLVLGFFVCHMLAFRVAMQDPSGVRQIAAVFFVWVSVFNLFAMSLFWSLMADLFDLAQAERVFGVIAVGGTLGAVTGPALTAGLVATTGIADLLLISALLLTAALLVTVPLLRRPPVHGSRPAGGEATGGSAWEGLILVLRSPYLLWFCVFLTLHSFVGTVLYFEQTRIVKDAFPTAEARTAFFARVDLAVNVLTALAQVFGLAPLVRRFGLSIALMLLPFLTAIGLIALGLSPVLTVLVVFGILRRAGEYAIARPAREMLFTVLPRAVKYKAKNFIDTAVFRGADAVSSWITDALRAAGHAGGTLAFLTLPAALAGIAIGWRLGRTRRILDVEEMERPHDTDDSRPRPAPPSDPDPGTRPGPRRP